MIAALKGVEAISHQVGGWHVVPDDTCVRLLSEQVSEELTEMMLRPGDALILVHDCRSMEAIS